MGLGGLVDVEGAPVVVSTAVNTLHHLLLPGAIECFVLAAPALSAYWWIHGDVAAVIGEVKGGVIVEVVIRLLFGFLALFGLTSRYPPLRCGQLWLLHHLLLPLSRRLEPG